MKQFLLLTSLFVLLGGSVRAWAEGPVTDFDKRAAATIYSALGGKDFTWQSMTEQHLKPGLTRYETNPTAKTATYAMNFGGNENGVDTRGFYRITIGEKLTDAASGGWTPFNTDSKSGVEILYKKVEKSDAEKYLNIAARKQVGRVVLAIAQRRPLGESVEAAAADVQKRFDTFLAQATRNQLFGGRIRIVLTNREGQPELPAGEPFLFSMKDNEPTVFALRIDALSSDDKLMENLKHISLELNGSIVPVAKVTVQGKPLDISKRYLEKNPPGSIEVVLTIPPASDPAVQEVLFNNLVDTKSPVQSWMLKVGLSQK